MKLHVLAALVAAGCQARRPEVTPAQLPCTPFVHAIGRRGPPHFEGHRFLGASADGKRVAFVVSDIGPGSGQPVGGLRVLEAGAGKEVLVKSYFDVHGTEADLGKVEDGVSTGFASDLSAAGVEVGQHVPDQQAWCTDGAGTIHTAQGAVFELRVTHPPCERDPAHQTVRWQLCTRDGTHCAGAGAECLDGDVSLRDLVSAGGTDWVLVDVLTHPFPDVDFHLFQAAGIPKLPR